MAEILFPVPPPGCDAHLFGGHPSVLDGRCRCMTCARCGHHSANTHQGHYGGWCSAARELRESHFCCPDPAFGCELTPPVAEPPEDASDVYKSGWADGMAGKEPDPDKLAYGAAPANDYERGYLESGTAEGAAVDLRAALEAEGG